MIFTNLLVLSDYLEEIGQPMEAAYYREYPLHDRGYSDWWDSIRYGNGYGYGMGIGIGIGMGYEY